MLRTAGRRVGDRSRRRDGMEAGDLVSLGPGWDYWNGASDKTGHGSANTCRSGMHKPAEPLLKMLPQVSGPLKRNVHAEARFEGGGADNSRLDCQLHGDGPPPWVQFAFPMVSVTMFIYG